MNAATYEQLSKISENYLNGLITALEFRNLFITTLMDIEPEIDLQLLASAVVGHVRTA